MISTILATIAVASLALVIGGIAVIVFYPQICADAAVIRRDRPA